MWIKTIMKGQLGTVEDWSIGTSWGIVGLAPDVPDQAMVDGILARLLTFTTTANLPTAMKALLSTNGRVIGWRIEARAEDESVLNVAEGLLGAAVLGNVAATKTPQDAVVLSLRTSTPGARGRGRMYYPALGAVVDASFQMTGPTPAATVSDAKTWLNAIGAQMNSYFSSISSPRTVALSVRSPTDHVCRDVNQIQVGSILDTQRRRRDNLPESYASTSYP